MATLPQFAYVAFLGATLCGAAIAIWLCTDVCLSGVHPQLIPFAASSSWHL